MALYPIDSDHFHLHVCIDDLLRFLHALGANSRTFYIGTRTWEKYCDEHAPVKVSFV